MRGSSRGSNLTLAQPGAAQLWHSTSVGFSLFPWPGQLVTHRVLPGDASRLEVHLLKSRSSLEWSKYPTAAGRQWVQSGVFAPFRARCPPLCRDTGFALHWYYEVGQLNSKRSFARSNGTWKYGDFQKYSLLHLKSRRSSRQATA